MIIEETTTYAYKLKYIDNVSFNRIRAFAQSFVNELPQELVDDIYEQLNRGLDLLQNEPQMLVYLYSFGNMHQAKLNRAFEQLPDAFLQQPVIRIVDYGCGQAIGTMCYADYLAEHGLSQTVKSITLIEPSEICLKRAALHVSQFFPDAKIHTVCKPFDDLTDDDLANSADIPTLHILSNVLDIQEFDLKDFATLIANNLSNYNQFVCVGPYFNYSDKDVRMPRFAELISGNITYSKIFEKGELCDGKTWTAQIVCFSVGKLLTEFELYKKDAENGDAKAQNNLGLCYRMGRGVEQDFENAFLWFSKAAERGNAEAQNNLGLCYKKARGVRQDYEKAFLWFSKAAQQGNKYAQYNLGDCYRNGQGAEQSYEKAVEWYTKSAEQGNRGAQNDLGLCYVIGQGVERDYQKAFDWFIKSAKQGDNNAAFNLESAFNWFSKPAEQGDKIAQYNIGVCYEKGYGVEIDFKKAFEWFAKSAEQGYAKALNSLGDCYYNGKGVEQNYKKAAEWYAKAAKKGSE